MVLPHVLGTGAGPSSIRSLHRSATATRRAVPSNIASSASKLAAVVRATVKVISSCKIFRMV